MNTKPVPDCDPGMKPPRWAWSFCGGMIENGFKCYGFGNFEVKRRESFSRFGVKSKEPKDIHSPF
jgi:hypothetical protein